MPIVQPVIWAPLTAFVVALAATAWLARSRFALLALDHPNPRSLHESPVPRTGGLGLLAGALCGWLLAGIALPLSLWAAIGMVFAISLLDDIRGVPVLPRLAVHLIAAGSLAAGTLLEERGVVATLIAIPAVAWMANLYNFMDGSDGLAGGMTLIGFSAYGAAGLAAGNAGFAAASFSIAAAAAAFLAFNLHPARVFLGDAGSVPIGFTAAAFGVTGWVNGYWAAWFPVLVFSPFIVDATVTLARRLLRRERVWEAHRDHYYQRLVRMGWGHRKTAWAEYALMAACAAAALAGLRQPAQVQIAILIAAAAGYLLLAAAVERAWKHSAAGR